MRLNEKQVQRLAQKVIDALKENNFMTLKASDADVLKRAAAVVTAEYTRERELDAEVQSMMDDLERQNPGSFERYKMFPLLKKRLAKEKGVIL